MTTGHGSWKRKPDSHHIKCETTGCPMFYNSNYKVITGYCRTCEDKRRRKRNAKELKCNTES